VSAASAGVHKGVQMSKRHKAGCLMLETNTTHQKAGRSQCG
jgi:hypothetical protein